MEGNVEWRPELVGSEYGAAICSARPELEEEDVRRRQLAAKVRWSVEEELRVGELASPCGGAQAMVFAYLNWGSIQLEDKATWWRSADIK